MNPPQYFQRSSFLIVSTALTVLIIRQKHSNDIFNMFKPSIQKLFLIQKTGCAYGKSLPKNPPTITQLLFLYFDEKININQKKPIAKNIHRCPSIPHPKSCVIFSIARDALISAMPWIRFVECALW
jgi:hypothetical protein